MKTRILLSFFALAFLFSFAMATNSAPVDPVGTWAYNAPDAPVEYSKGQIVFSREGGELKGSMVIDTYRLALENLKLEGNALSFAVDIDGEYVRISLELTNDTFSGKASYSEGSLPISGSRVKE